MYTPSQKQSSLAKVSKNLGRNKYGLIALPIIVFAVCLRMVLTALGWPATNSDEATIGLMARHIAYNGEHPVEFYTRNYLGAVEAYLGAAFFRLFGPSLFTLRLGIILLDALFLVSMYLLVSLLYTKKLALFVLILLALGSSAMFLRELYATGGTTQTLLFGTVAFLLSAWLALTYRQDLPRGRRWLRYAAYAGWGLVVGLGIWSDMVIVPVLLTSSLLLLLCWRDLRSLAPLCLLLGLLIGIFPLIIYNLQAPPGMDSWSMVIGLFQGTNVQSAHTLPQLIRGMQNTLDISLPTATGDPFCQVPAVNYVTDSSPHSLHCIVLHAGWCTGYIILWLLAVTLTVRKLWQLRTPRQTSSPEQRQEIVLHLARLSLLATAAIAVVGYAVSSGPQGAPHTHARYLVTLLIVTPAIIWPLWSAASTSLSLAKNALQQPFAHARPLTMLSRGILLLITMLFLLGTITIASDISSSQQADQQQAALITHLEQMGITHIYSDFWTCNRLIFVSQEKIICGVTDNALLPTHNYYPPYYTIVHADPHSSYVYPYDIFQQPSLLQQADILGHGFRRSVFVGYIIYQPV